MTHLSKRVRRETNAGSYGPVIVTLAPEGIYTREKGRRTTYGPIAFSHIHTLGATMRAQQVKKDRLMARKARKEIRCSR